MCIGVHTGGGLVGHIEDIAVSSSAQGRKFGLRIIQALVGISETVGAYKTILDCNADNIGQLHRGSSLTFP